MTPIAAVTNAGFSSGDIGNTGPSPIGITDTGPSPGDVGALVDHLSRALHDASFSDNLTPAQWNALRYLGRANMTACTVTAFAHHHRTKKSTACQTMNALIEKQLIARETDAEDSRVKCLTLTERGTAILLRDPVHILARAVNGLPRDELHSVTRALELMLRTLHGESARDPDADSWEH